MNETNDIILLEPLSSVTTDTYSGVYSAVYSPDTEYIASRIDYQTSAIHMQFAVLILVLVFLKVWRRGK